MRKKLHIIFFAITIISFSTLIAQTNTMVVTSADGKPQNIIDNINGAVVPVVKPGNIEGSPYLGDGWGTGSVYFKKGKWADSLDLIFDLHENRIFFKQEGVILAFAEEVSAFVIRYKAGEENKEAYFKKGYPGNKEKKETYYNIIAEGANYHLIRLLTKNINEVYTYNGISRKKYEPVEEWFLYDVNAAVLEKIKPEKNSLIKKMPQAATQIKQLCSQNQWDLKSETELISLFNILNGQL